MAKRLKKEKVNVDVINFGEEVFLFFLTFWAYNPLKHFFTCTP